jgi:hypothetical protein
MRQLLLFPIVVIGLSFLALSGGCADERRPNGRGELELDVSEIRSLCDSVAKKAMAEVRASWVEQTPLGSVDDAEAKILYIWTEEGSKAQCELEYRIKQQQILQK